MSSTTSLRVCEVCDFALFHPLGEWGVTAVGLYDDARFPGRLIVAYRVGHEERFEDTSEAVSMAFLHDVKRVARAIRIATDCERVNLAILGNAQAHLHAHLVPRRPSQEPEPTKAPWSDPRSPESLEEPARQRLSADLWTAITEQFAFG